MFLKLCAGYRLEGSIQKASRNHHFQSELNATMHICFESCCLFVSEYTANSLCASPIHKVHQYWQTSWLSLDKSGLLFISQVVIGISCMFVVDFAYSWRFLSTAKRGRLNISSSAAMCSQAAFSIFLLPGRENPIHELFVYRTPEKNGEAPLVLRQCCAMRRSVF
jgi:hypothetical protein